MPPRAHLTSLRVGHAIREVLAEGYHRGDLLRDILAGLTVGVISIPLAMALAIACGVAPQYGLYTSIIAGAVIALSGGSRYSISGPTAAFVVILQPLAAMYGLGGLLLASLMAGMILLLMAYARLGRFIEYIPETVTLGFTGGIAIVIAFLQVPDFLGLNLAGMPHHFIDKLWLVVSHLDQTDGSSAFIAVFTLSVMLLWPRLKTAIPPHLPALVSACIAALLLGQAGLPVETIGSRFHYLLADGSQAAGVPPYLPSFEWPWQRAGANGAPLGLSWGVIADLLPAAFAIAMLGAIESLLCAVVLDGMSGKRHSANSELLGQGLANIITPFFGGITATAAIARSATNYKSGAVSPLSAVIHSVVVLLGLLLLSRALSFIPMPAMAALLMVVAWKMSEAAKSVRLVKRSPLNDIVVWLTCLSLTVFFDMVIAIVVGVLLASILFMREIAGLTQLVDITDNRDFVHQPLPVGCRVFKVNGPLFFAAADRVMSELADKATDSDTLILHMRYSAYLDAGGLSSMEKLMAHCAAHQTRLYFSSWQFQPMRTLARAQRDSLSPLHASFSSLDEAVFYCIETGKRADET